jgi:hypothetical protein
LKSAEIYISGTGRGSGFTSGNESKTLQEMDAIQMIIAVRPAALSYPILSISTVNGGFYTIRYFECDNI